MIYLDNAATTKTAPEVLEAMLPCFREVYGNPGGLYRPGFEAKKLVNNARRIIAESLGVDSGEIYFTSGGTEADNWALRGAADALREKGRHLITSGIEHHAILHTCEYLEKQGFSVTYLPVDGMGRVDPESVRRAIRRDTILISIMFANNEIGTIQPIAEIGAIAREKGILFHTDAVQAYGQMPLNVREYQIDMLSASAHKLKGPKGIGFLYVRSGVNPGVLLYGGGQERGRRSGTENVPGIVGMGAAARLAAEQMEEKREKEQRLRDYLIQRLETEIPDCRLNGDRVNRLPGNVNVSFPGIEGESLLIMLDMEGICASSGSACSSGSQEPSHVLTAIGLEAEEARGSLRLTLSMENTQEEIDRTVEKIKEIVGKLRSLRE